MLHTKFMEIGQPVLERKIFEGFLPYMGIAAMWSCDPDATNKLPFPYTSYGEMLVQSLTCTASYRR